MWDIVEGLHKALRIESTWAFVLVVAGGWLIGGGIAWIIDAGYKNSSEYKTEHPDPKFQAAASMSAQTLTATPQQSVSQAARRRSNSDGKAQAEPAKRKLIFLPRYPRQPLPNRQIKPFRRILVSSSLTI